MRVTLAAIADDRDLLGLDEVHICVAVVINPHFTVLVARRVEI